MKRSERTVSLTLLDDGLHHLLTHATHASKTKTDAAINRGEFQARRVDIGRKHGGAVVVRAGNVADELVVAAHVAGEHRCHEFVRVVRLQVSRAHDQDGVCRRMRLVERIFRELLGILPDLLGNFERIAVLDRT